ncbi:MAG: cysteine desulfurase NifS [Firmicutes bacterium]|nr:cysteine desulfurase NifS [Bacillota bacterium]
MDYSATTPVKAEVMAEMLPYFTMKFGNPSSLYGPGFEARDGVEAARHNVAHLIGAADKEVYFTSCGTEADDWALKGVAELKKAKGKHIITTTIEHHAILHTCEYLEKQGYEVTYLGVDAEGQISLEELENAIRPDTILVSIMFANNEMGAILPIKEAAAIAHKHDVLFHTDAVQALSNGPIDVKDLDVDLMSISGHKIYAPKGIGALYIRKGLVLPNLLHGGAQESKRRAGTENVTGIIGFGKAAQMAEENLDYHIKHITELRDYFIENVQKRISNVRVNGGMEHRLPGNVNMIFDFIEGEALLGYLDMQGIYISTGSACSSGSFAPSHVLAAMGLPPEKIYSSLRFSIGDFTTKADLDYVVDCLERTVQTLRSFSPFNEEHPMFGTTQVHK